MKSKILVDFQICINIPLKWMLMKTHQVLTDQANVRYCKNQVLI